MLCSSGLALFVLLQLITLPETKLSTEAGVSALIALLGTFYSLNLMAINTRPYLMYVSRQTQTSELELDRQQAPFWRISLKNVGAGNARLKTLRFHWKQKKAPESWIDSIQHFQHQGLTHGQDFVLFNLTNSVALPSKQEICLLEIPLSKLPQLNNLTIHFTFEDTLGKTRKGKVRCLPQWMQTPELSEKPNRNHRLANT